MRDCGGGHASALWGKILVEAAHKNNCARHGLCESREHQFVAEFEFTAGRGLRMRKEISPT